MDVAEGLQSSWERAVTVAMKPEVTNGDRAYLSAEEILSRRSLATQPTRACDFISFRPPKSSLEY